MRVQFGNIRTPPASRKTVSSTVYCIVTDHDRPDARSGHGPGAPSIEHARQSYYADDMLIAALKGIDFFTWLDAHPLSVADIARSLRVSLAAGGRDDDAVRRARAHGARRRCSLYAPAASTSSPPRRGSSGRTSRRSDRPIALDPLAILAPIARPTSPAGRTRDDCTRRWKRQFAEEFPAAMDFRGRSAQALAGLSTSGAAASLDVAGGIGIFACALAARFPDLPRSCSKSRR